MKTMVAVIVFIMFFAVLGFAVALRKTRQQRSACREISSSDRDKMTCEACECHNRRPN